MIRSALRLACPLAAILACTTQSLAADPAPAAPPTPPRIAYWDNWTDVHGVSHLSKCAFTDFSLNPVAPGIDPEWRGRAMHGPARVVMDVHAAHWKGGWHENPVVQWIVPMSGTLVMKAMDGTQVELNAGDVVLGEDLNTRPDAHGNRGHFSGNIGDDPVILLVTQFTDARAAHHPCPVH